MNGFTNIKDFVQEYAENMAEVLGLDVTILGEDCIRISGTGVYRDLIGEPAPRGSFFETILQTGKPGIIFDTKKNESQCRQCMFIDQCQEMATIGFPIFNKGRAVGVIGIIGFTSSQKETMVNSSTKLLNFLSHMSSLLENKLTLVDLYQKEACQVQEDRNSPNRSYSFERLIGYQTGLQEVVKKAKKVMNSTSSVLIRGESGTGKELLAQSMHYESVRAKYPFVAINCAAIPENLLESELFGYEGGAFTGSKREGKMGKFEVADKGTIFLDEIGDLPPTLQPKLLRVLQERVIDPIGGRKPIPIDVRVIAATNKDLEAMVENGTFREDLYYRIHVIPLNLTPLRKRQGDILLYVNHFVGKYSMLLNKKIADIEPALEKWIIHYNWPGNIRQLENAIEYMVNMAETQRLGMEDLPEYLLQKNNHKMSDGISLENMISAYEKEILQSYLDQEQFKVDKAKMAHELQTSISTLYRKIEKYQLD
jgi:transcriptional regulator with GAF, ATPase, and Fis domain